MDIRIFIEPQQGATYQDQARIAVATEDAGLDGFFRSDHFLAMGSNYRRDVGPTDSWVTLGAIARETKRIRLGTLLTAATFRYPGPLGVAVAQVDEMSNGRVELGLGAAWFKEEHEAYGIPFWSSFDERLSRLEEQLEIITGMWATPLGETFDYKGRYYELINCPALPKPHQQRPPVIVGGSGLKRTPALAARFANEFNLPFQSVDSAAVLFSALDAACEQFKRDPEEITRSVALTAVIGRNDAECETRAIAIGRDLAEVRNDGLAGTPDEIAHRLSDYAATGASRVYLQVLDLTDLDQIELIGSELAPRVSGL